MKNAVIFGYSRIGIQLLDIIRDSFGKVVFCDNTSSKHGTVNNYEIVSVERAVNEYRDGVFFLATAYHQKEMKEQLIRLGLKKEQIMDKIPSSIIEYEKEFIKKRTITPRDKLRFEINISRHCNLNCRSCDHFSPLAKETFMKINDLERDLDRLSYLFNGEAEQILILGGEPLLNRDIDRFMEICRKYFIKAQIRLVTNGMLVKKMPTNFWRTMETNNIILSVTKYPIDLDYEWIQKEAENNKVKFEFFGITEAGRSFWHTPIDLNGKQDGYNSFTSCRVGNWCITLDKGKLYACETAANIDLFNEAFQTNIPLDSNDVVDIYEYDSAESILNRLSRPMSLCKFCNINKRTYDNKWEVSKRIIEEWT